MQYLIEALFVGIYTSIVYLCITMFSISPYNLLFIVGFFKHLFGYLLNLHTYYCNYGDACANSIYPRTSNITFLELFIESLLEGVTFMILGGILYRFSILRKNTIFTFFIIGFSLHIICELLGIHKQFCKKRCIRNNNYDKL